MKDRRTIWMEGNIIKMVDQNLLPYSYSILACNTTEESCRAISEMNIRGAGAIGAAAAYAMAQACMLASESNYSKDILQAKKAIEKTRPTARNLFYAIEKVYEAGTKSAEEAFQMAEWLAEKDIEDCNSIGKFGNEIIPERAGIATHCNAGWLAFLKKGTALSPIYTAHEKGKDVFVYADETRPRSQGARLTAWELNDAGIPHAIIPDNATAYLMSKGKIDLMITGADRIAVNGDVANKIGTLEKAIVAKEYGIPFYVAAPLSTFDFDCTSGKDIPIEERSADEVLYQRGPDENGAFHTIRVASPGSKAINPAFDVTPARFISGIITEKGIVNAELEKIRALKQYLA